MERKGEKHLKNRWNLNVYSKGVESVRGDGMRFRRREHNTFQENKRQRVVSRRKAVSGQTL